MRFPINPAFWFLAPAVFLITLFFLIPAAASLMLSFTDFDIYALGDFHQLRFIGLDNYVRLLHDPILAIALRNTLYFMLAGGSLSVALSLGAALMINHPLTRWRGFFRTVLFLPVVTTLVAVAVVWRYLYHPRYGYLNQLLTYFGMAPIDWLGNSYYAMPAIIILSIWKNFGFNMIVFLAGLQNIPQHLYEAASLDGANEWQKFRYITLPMLKPTFVFVLIVTLIGNLQLFAEPYVMTQGGPDDSTMSLSLLMFQEGFRWWNLGYAAAIAFLLFLIILAGTLFYLWIRRKQA